MPTGCGHSIPLSHATKGKKCGKWTGSLIYTANRFSTVKFAKLKILRCVLGLHRGLAYTFRPTTIKCYQRPGPFIAFHSFNGMTHGYRVIRPSTHAHPTC